MKLKNLKKTPIEIAICLTRNTNIVKLIYDDSIKALSNTIELPSAKELITKDYISFYPATESGIQDIDKNTFIVINMENFNLQSRDNNILAFGTIYITTDKAHCVLENNKLRLLELIDEIDTTLENVKLSCAGKLELTSADYVIFSSFRSGYRINFNIRDQQKRKAEL